MDGEVRGAPVGQHLRAGGHEAQGQTRYVELFHRHGSACSAPTLRDRISIVAGGREGWDSRREVAVMIDGLM